MRRRIVSSVLLFSLASSAMAQEGRRLRPRADGRAVGPAKESYEPRGGDPVLRTEQLMSPGKDSGGAAEGAPIEGGLSRQGLEQPGVVRGTVPSKDAVAGQTSADPAKGAHSRGEYLVTRVALCVMCHSPRDTEGDLIQSGLLMGGKVPILPAYPDMNWPYVTPRLSGMPSGYDADALVRLLTAGVTAAGQRPRLPMPPFRMEEADARAIAGYLESLGGKPVEMAFPVRVQDRASTAGALEPAQRN